MSEKEFKNNRPKSDEKDLEGLVQNFSQKVEPATKKVKKTVGKIENIPSHPRDFDNSSATPNSLYLFWYRAGNGEVSPDFNSRELEKELYKKG